MKRAAWIPLIALILGALALARPSSAQDAKDDAKLKRARAASRMIDARIDLAIAKSGIEPAGQAVNEAIVRRLALDISGVVPSAETVTTYLKSRKKDKLLTLIDELLESDGFSEQWTNVFTQAWIGRRMRRRITPYFREWLMEQLQKRRPFDEIVRAVISAEGALDENGAGAFMYRWEVKPSDVAANSARVFLGLQIQCATCHDHPFSDWKQEQFHEFASFFSGLRRGNKKVGDKRISVVREAKSSGYSYKIKRTGADTRFSPKFLFDIEGLEREHKGPGGRKAVAALMTHPENPYFARMCVNRVWKSMFGRGLVEPVEDLEGQEGYHPMLLAFLAEDFIASGFDLRHLVRTVALSRAYQRSSRRKSGEKDPAVEYARLAKSKDKDVREAAALRAQQEVWLFARASLRPLSPEQIASSLFQATGVADLEASGKKSAKRFQNLRRQLLRQFNQLYGEADSANPDSFDGTIPQTLIMLNGNFVNEAIKPQAGTALAHILADVRKPKDVVTMLFMNVLSRRPTKTESRVFTNYIGSRGANNTTYVDLMWALINSTEFLMNH